MTKRKKPRRKPPAPERRELALDELEAILERTKSLLSSEDHDKLEAAIDTLAVLTAELERKGTTIHRLRKLIFGARTETTGQVLEGQGQKKRGAGSGRSRGAKGSSERSGGQGHGRHGAAAYTGAEKVEVSHPSLQHGDACPHCQQGKVYRQRQPAVLVRVTGMAPLSAWLYELERLRCHLCGIVFKPDPPPGVGEAKYDETASAMIGMLKYGCGLPFHRLQQLQDSLGIPMPATTQWEVVSRAAERLQPAYDELICQAAQGQVLHNDDTTMKILDLDRSAMQQLAAETTRTGVFTSGIVSTGEGHRIALFFTGPQHAGENLADVLARRAAERAPPIQMSDALSRNTSGELDTVVAHCLAHGRRRFVEVADHFPDECRYVLETLREVYHHDAVAKQRALSADDRLALHQENSQTLMDDLHRWLHEQLDERKVEPNSSLGEAIRYMIHHWPELTLFLREPGAPLDNNICERTLKKAILHRKNAYFYKTHNGARVGDLFMSLIHSAELERINAFDYLVALQRHSVAVAQAPSAWMPWNYTAALERALGSSETTN